MQTSHVACNSGRQGGKTKVTSQNEDDITRNSERDNFSDVTKDMNS